MQGDLLVDGLGLSDEDRQVIVDNVDVVINSAASVSFDDPIQEAFAINYFGSYRMQELAKSCKKCVVFCQVSTAYVNSNRFGLIEE